MQFRLANIDDLPDLKVMFKHIVANMYENNIKIWNDFYPFEELPTDIKQQSFYLLEDHNVILAAVGIYDTLEGQNDFEWKDTTSKAAYLGRLGVNVDFLRQGIGSIVLEYCTKIACNKQAEFLRLLVSDENIPAIALYRKNNYKQVKGSHKEFSPALNKEIIEMGFEKAINAG